MSLPRMPEGVVKHTLKIEACREDFEQLLPRCTPQFTYTVDGQDWVRLVLPLGVLPGVEDMQCPCCGAQALRSQHSVSLDVRYEDVNWYIGELP